MTLIAFIVIAAYTIQFPLAITINGLRGRRGRRAARLLYRYGYLKTPWWKLVSMATKRRARHRCEACRIKTSRLDAHHKGSAAYSLLAREWAPWRGLTPLLEALCRPCHARRHSR